jgi:putative ABC transport system permease protein
VEGRFFAEEDDQREQPVVIVDDQLAQRAWPGRSAIGQQIAADPFTTGHPVFWATVIGVVGHVRHRSLLENLGDQVYFAQRQVQRNPFVFVVRTTGDPTPLAAAARRAVNTLDPQLPIYDVRPLAEYVIGARASHRFTTILAITFAAVALLLASIGVYGVIAYATTRRRYEFGVRLALGARPREVLALVLREGVVLAAIGLTAGLAGAALAARVLRTQLYGVAATDVASYAVAVLAIGLVALAASWVPARRASAISPLTAMRTD